MHKLVPFSHDFHKVSVEGDLEIIGQKLLVRFQWKDPHEELIFSDHLRLERAHELWKHTCFEAFLRPDGEPGYLEINVAPSGAWQAYEFSGYRDPEPPKETHDVELLSFHLEEKVLEAQFVFRRKEHHWHCGLAAVIEVKDHSKHYLALRHYSEKPDFHRNESFSLRKERR